MHIMPGITRFLQKAPAYRGQRLALATNDAALTPDGQPSREALLRAGFGLCRLFAPEHGMARSGADGAAQPHGTDACTGLPITSLYGAQLAPTAADLADVDTVLFDMPDVGCRFYTYLWTMTHLMEACAAHGKPLVVLDRPNPTGALLHMAEGPWLDEATCGSFIGRWNMPLRHCCTLGELARYFAATRLPGLQLTVEPVSGYQRRHRAPLHFPFVATSPAMPTAQSALLYPGTGLLEGLNLNEGRGTQMPFALIGAPWLNNDVLGRELWAAGILRATPLGYTAAAGPYAGLYCRGLLLQVTDAEAFTPVQWGLQLLAALVRHHPNELRERPYPTVANPGGMGHLDRLLGQPQAFAHLLRGGTWHTAVPQWAGLVGPYLLY
jgi:uncharacterized protein YbbC (DUF1343 family)